jgi:hypothetical protein
MITVPSQAILIILYTQLGEIFDIEFYQSLPAFGSLIFPGL